MSTPDTVSGFRYVPAKHPSHSIEKEIFIPSLDLRISKEIVSNRFSYTACRDDHPFNFELEIEMANAYCEECNQGRQKFDFGKLKQIQEQARIEAKEGVQISFNLANQINQFVKERDVANTPRRQYINYSIQELARQLF